MEMHSEVVKPGVSPESKTDDIATRKEGIYSAKFNSQLIKCVHELYEQLGREEVQSVEDLEKAIKNKSNKNE